LKDKFRVLFVCTGNTCRSPMAEGILRKILEDRGIDNIEVSSAGISAEEGYPAARNAVIVSRDWGIDLTSHISRQVSEEMINSSDLILAMSSEHYDKLKQFPSADEKVFLLKGFPKRPNDMNMETVDDPIGESLQVYSRVFLELDEIIRKILPKIIELSKKPQ